MTCHGSDPMLVQPFPKPGPSITLAYYELRLYESGTPAQRAVVGRVDRLQRPWDPASCTDRFLRRQLWTWLDAVVAWLNHEYTWDVGTAVVPCWPAHPDLVHEVALLADRRYRAGLSSMSDLLEEWHRYSLPTFTERTRSRARAQVCDSGHQPRPSRAQLVEHDSSASQRFRSACTEDDVDSLPQETVAWRHQRAVYFALDTGGAEGAGA